MATVGVVWVRWKDKQLPARWIDLADVATDEVRAALRNQRVRQKRKRANGSGEMQLVHFFGSGEYSWRKFSDLSHFAPGSASRSLLATPSGSRAVEQAEEYLALLQQPAREKRTSVKRGSSKGADEEWSSFWLRLLGLGWEERQGKRRQDRLFIPPLIDPKSAVLRRDYFDSRVQVRRHVASVGRQRAGRAPVLAATGEEELLLQELKLRYFELAGVKMCGPCSHKVTWMQKRVQQLEERAAVAPKLLPQAEVEVAPAVALAALGPREVAGLRKFAALAPQESPHSVAQEQDEDGEDEEQYDRGEVEGQQQGEQEQQEQEPGACAPSYEFADSLLNLDFVEEQMVQSSVVIEQASTEIHEPPREGAPTSGVAPKAGPKQLLPPTAAALMPSSPAEDTDWATLWEHLRSQGWRERQQKPDSEGGRQCDRFFLPPGVEPHTQGASRRRDYFDSRVQVRNFLQGRGSALETEHKVGDRGTKKLRTSARHSMAKPSAQRRHHRARGGSAAQAAASAASGNREEQEVARKLRLAAKNVIAHPNPPLRKCHRAPAANQRAAQHRPEKPGRHARGGGPKERLPRAAVAAVEASAEGPSVTLSATLSGVPCGTGGATDVKADASEVGRGLRLSSERSLRVCTTSGLLRLSVPEAQPIGAFVGEAGHQGDYADEFNYT